MEGSAELSSNEKGDRRLDYSKGGKRQIRLWEKVGSAILETTFREDGAILHQQGLEEKEVDSRIKQTLAEAKVGVAAHAEYRKVLLDRACPWCSKMALVRFVESHRSQGRVPVVPIYHCTQCRGKSYYLTDEYLTSLIENNPNMFDAKEIESFKANREAFVAEIKAYIISTFASKKVKRIN